MRKLLWIAAGFALLAGGSAASAREDALNSNTKAECQRECLYAFVDDYLEALVDKDSSRLPWADHVVFTENNVQLAIGDGLWGTISGIGDYDLKMADPQNGQVGWFGIVKESDVPAIMALRMKIAGGKIEQVETIVSRSVANSPFPSVKTYIAPRQLMLDDVPVDRRRPRARLLSVADGYFDTIQLNDGQILTEFAEDCDRIENGLQTTNNAAGFPTDYPIAAFGCEEQFRKGQYKYDDRLRDRRFPLVDEEKGLVLAGGFIDHAGKLVDFTWTDGTPVKSFYHFPHSYALLELFKIVDGKIAGVEAVFIDVPYNMPSPWIGKQAYVVKEH